MKAATTHMGSHTHSRAMKVLKYSFLVLSAIVSPFAYAADHSDAIVLIDNSRLDANLQDLYAWTNGSGDEETLVLAITWSAEQGLAPNRFVNASDKSFVIHVDLDSAVDTSVPTDIIVPPGVNLGDAGGAIADPANIASDVRIKITFDDSGQATFQYEGFNAGGSDPNVNTFIGLREDPFLNNLVNELDVGA
ncbi:MAG: hypothetical protein ACKVHP_04705, partial [Verrucomicrobiales bacterium]